MPTLIKFIDTETERNAVYRFRYQIYCEEMGRVQQYADHTAKTIREPLDEHAHIMAAYEDGELVATLRSNFACQCDLGYYPELYNMAAIASVYPRHVSMGTKFMMLPRYRRGTLAVRIMMAAFKRGMEEDIRFDFLDCNPHLEPFFAGMGYRPSCGRVHHPEYGDVQPLYLAFGDAEHLRAVGSPFAKLLPAFAGS